MKFLSLRREFHTAGYLQRDSDGKLTKTKWPKVIEWIEKYFTILPPPKYASDVRDLRVKSISTINLREGKFSRRRWVKSLVKLLNIPQGTNTSHGIHNPGNPTKNSPISWHFSPKFANIQSFKQANKKIHKIFSGKIFIQLLWKSGKIITYRIWLYE